MNFGIVKFIVNQLTEMKIKAMINADDNAKVESVKLTGTIVVG